MWHCITTAAHSFKFCLKSFIFVRQISAAPSFVSLQIHCSWKYSDHLMYMFITHYDTNFYDVLCYPKQRVRSCNWTNLKQNDVTSEQILSQYICTHFYQTFIMHINIKILTKQKVQFWNLLIKQLNSEIWKKNTFLEWQMLKCHRKL